MNTITPGDDRLPPRFWAKVSVDPSGCWLWTGGDRGRGYGCVRWGGVVRPAHRVALEVLGEQPIPPALVVDHLCRVKACVNPAHLEAVTQAVNVQRGLVPLVGRNGDVCRNGVHPWPESASPSTGKCRHCSRNRTRAYRLRRQAARASA